MKKEKLIKALKVAINALKNDTINYKWQDQHSCNCGVVAQAILDKTKTELKNLYDDSFQGFKDPTWKNLVKSTCSITGKTTSSIIKRLIENGLSIEDICHLEYLENEAILKRANIYYSGTISETKKVGTKKVLVRKRWLLSDEYKEEDVLETKNRVVKNYLLPDYYQKKENLIKYLIAWVEILEEQEKELTPKLNKIELKEELLKCVESEQYEKAAKLRDQIAVS